MIRRRGITVFFDRNDDLNELKSKLLVAESKLRDEQTKHTVDMMMFFFRCFKYCEENNYCRIMDNDVKCNEPENESKVCDICMKFEKNVAFVPCGHTCCYECKKRIQYCHICRKPITKVIRIYI